MRPSGSRDPCGITGSAMAYRTVCCGGPRLRNLPRPPGRRAARLGTGRHARRDNAQMAVSHAVADGRAQWPGVPDAQWQGTGCGRVNALFRAPSAWPWSEGRAAPCARRTRSSGARARFSPQRRKSGQRTPVSSFEGCSRTPCRQRLGAAICPAGRRRACLSGSKDLTPCANWPADRRSESTSYSYGRVSSQWKSIVQKLPFGFWPPSGHSK